MDLSYLAILAGGILYMIYGTIYYSIMLSDKKENKNKDILEQQSEGPFKYIYSVVIAFINSLLVAVLVQATGAETWTDGLMVGLIIGVLITLIYFKNSLFGLMSRRVFFIAIGEHLVIFTLLGILHGIMA